MPIGRHQESKYRDAEERFGARNPSILKAYSEAETMLNVFRRQLYARNGLGSKKDLTLFKRRQLAVVRAKYDQPIARIGQFLRALDWENMDGDTDPILEDKLVQFYTDNYRWLDEPTALWLVNQIVDPTLDTKGEIFYDRHFRGGNASSGEDGEPYESISFSSDIDPSTLMFYIECNKHYVREPDDQPINKSSHWDMKTIRKIIIHNLYYRYCKFHYSGKLTANEILDIHNELASKNNLDEWESPDYAYTRLRQDILEVNKEFEESPLHQALELFENDFTKNKQWYKKNAIICDTPSDDDCGVISQDKLLFDEAKRHERFTLEFDADNNKFIASKTAKNTK